jgi:hypothetical protein
MRSSAILISVIAGSVGLTATTTMAAQDCASLANLKIENTNLLSSTEVPAAGDLPAYCRVLGFVRPAINFESACRFRAGTASSTWPDAAGSAARSMRTDPASRTP